MPAHWGTMSENIAESPQKYSTVFGSQVPRFDAKYYGASICKEENYNVNQGAKIDLATGVAQSKQLLSHMRGDKPRMTYHSPDNRDDINTNVAHKKAMTEMLPDMAINYSTMRSDTKRFAPMGNEKKMLDVVYDIDCGNKVSVGRGVEQSRQSYPVFRSASERFGKGSFLDVGEPQGGEYNTDTGHKMMMVHASDVSPFKLSNMNSKTNRFKTSGLMDRSYSEAQYNIDTGHKKTLATGVEDTPLTYSNVRTTTKRFPARRLSANSSETQYNTDCGPKLMMTTAVARNEIPSAAITTMRSRTKRFSRTGQQSEGIDGGGYDIDTGHKASMTKMLGTTSIKYANVRTKTDRFQKSFHDPPLDVVYDTDTGHKMAMTTAVAASPINYANMNSTVPRWKNPRRDETKRASGEFYRPNERLLERLYDHFQKTGKLKQLQAEFAHSNSSGSN